MLGHDDLINGPLSKAFTLSCQCRPIGGFSKCPGAHPDILHSYFALCGLSIIGEEKEKISSLSCAFGMTTRAAKGLLTATEWMKRKKGEEKEEEKEEGKGKEEEGKGK